MNDVGLSWLRDPLIVEERPDWLFLRKRSGEPTLLPNDGSDRPSTLGRLLEAAPWQGELAWPPGFEGGIAHRLDVQTSGLVVAATSVDALADGRELFARGALRKHYRFLTDRDVEWDEHVVAWELAHDRKDRRKMVWRRGRSTPHRGRWYPAETELQRVGVRGSLHEWEAIIRTGVTHQIRVHAASCGLALLGDRLYGGTADPDGFRLHHVGIDGWPGGTPRLDPPWEE